MSDPTVIAGILASTVTLWSFGTWACTYQRERTTQGRRR
jgi:hypothetical protein